jgi:hypothetical protein
LPDAPTPWELHRTLSAIREDMREGFKGLNQRLDRNISVELFNAYQESVAAKFTEMANDITDIKAERDAEKKQRATDRRMIFTAVFTSIIAPLVFLLLNLYMTSKGTSTR